MEHKSLTINHRLESWVYGNDAERTGATGFVSGDIGRIAYQTDTGSYWRLLATTPTWAAIVIVPADAVSSVFGRTGAVVAAVNDYSYAQLSGKPTTLSGYGITDAVSSVFGRTGTVVAATNDYSYAQLSGKPVYASLQSADFNPVGTSSTVGVMVGLGNIWTITPMVTGKVLITIKGNILNNGANFSAAATLYYGTGSNPANGAALAGTSTANSVFFSGTRAASLNVPFSITSLLTGLAINTAIWIDLAQATGAGGGTLIANVSCTAVELP